MKKNYSLKLFLIALISVNFIFAQSQLPVSDAGFAQNNATAAVWDSSDLLAKKDVPSWGRKIFINVPISGLSGPTLTSGIFKIYLTDANYNDAGAGGVVLSLEGYSNVTNPGSLPVSSGLTYNTDLTGEGMDDDGIVATFEYADSEPIIDGVWLEFDIKDYLNDRVTTGATNIFLVLKVTSNPTPSGGILFTFVSEESANSTFVPYVSVEGATLSVNELFNDNLIQVYPNPTNGLLNIDQIGIGSKVQLMSITGQVIYSEKSTSESHIINTRSFAKGIYMLKISNENSSMSGKIIVE